MSRALRASRPRFRLLPHSGVVNIGSARIGLLLPGRA